SSPPPHGGRRRRVAAHRHRWSVGRAPRGVDIGVALHARVQSQRPGLGPGRPARTRGGTDPPDCRGGDRAAGAGGGAHRAGRGPQGGGLMSSDSIVQARRLRKVYRGANEVEALRGIDLEVGRGEMVAIVGPSGSGKTTLLNCLSGLDAFDGGQVVVDGQDLSTMSDRARTAYRSKNMGFVFQAFNLLPVLSAVENVEIPLLLQNLNSRDSRRRSLEMLETLGLAHRANHRPDQLSGGEQQRVAVARALVQKPAVVWADEPTGNLDTEVTQVIVELLVRM